MLPINNKLYIPVTNFINLKCFSMLYYIKNIAFTV